MGSNTLEKEKIYKWAVDNFDKESVFTAPGVQESYYIKKETHNYLTELNYQSIPDLSSIFDVLWQDDKAMEDIKKVVMIAAMKNKISFSPQDGKSTENISDEEDSILAFRYMF